MGWDDVDINKRTDDFLDRMGKRVPDDGGNMSSGPRDSPLKAETIDRLPKVGDTVNLGPWVLKIKAINLKNVVLKRVGKPNPNRRVEP